MGENNSPADKVITSWRITGLALITISAGFYLYVQGSHVGASGIISDKATKYVAAVYGLLVLIPLSAYFYSYTYHAIKFIEGMESTLNFPLLHELHLSKDNSLVIKAKTVSLIVIFVVPMFSIVHCYKKSLDATVYLNESCVENVCKEVWSNNVKGSLTKFSGFCEIFTDGNRYRLDGQITYFPGWQPWLELILIIWVFKLWGRTLYVLFSSPRSNA